MVSLKLDQISFFALLKQYKYRSLFETFNFYLEYFKLNLNFSLHIRCIYLFLSNLPYTNFISPSRALKRATGAEILKGRVTFWSPVDASSQSIGWDRLVAISLHCLNIKDLTTTKVKQRLQRLYVGRIIKR